MNVLIKGLGSLKELKSILTFDPVSLSKKEQPYLESLQDNFTKIIGEIVQLNVNNHLESELLQMTNSYSIVSQYESLLKEILNEFESKVKSLGLLDYEVYYYMAFEKKIADGEEVLQNFNDLFSKYKNENTGLYQKYGMRDIKKIIEKLADEEDSVNFEDEFFEIQVSDQNFVYKLERVSRSFNHLIDGFKAILDKDYVAIVIKDFSKLARELYKIASLRLRDLEKKRDVFIDDSMVLVAYKVFVELRLLEYIPDKEKSTNIKIDLKDFKNQFQYRDRRMNLTFRKSKTEVARAIEKLLPFIQTNYRDEWKEKMIIQLGLNPDTYYKLKNRDLKNNKTLNRIDEITLKYQKLYEELL